MELIPGRPPTGFRASIAGTYDAVADRREEMGEADWRWPIAEAFRAGLVARGGTRLLEIGAGVGFTSRWFADRGLQVVATDLSPRQVELCRAKGLEAHVMDMYDLAFPDGSFDGVWMMNCIHHVPPDDVAGVLREVSRVLVPGGLLYLGVWGGIDSAGFPVDDFYQPPRYFCFRSDATLREGIGAVFDIEDFDTFQPEEDADGLHMQSVLARSRGGSPAASG